MRLGDYEDDRWARFLDGAPLDPVEERSLFVSLETQAPLRENRMVDMRLDGMLRSDLRAQRDSDVFLRGFQARLRAIGTERQFATAVGRRLQGHRRAKRVFQVAFIGLAAAAAALILLAVGRWRDVGRIVVEGDARVLRDGATLATEHVRRGDRIVVGQGGARLQLGNCCLVDLASGHATLVGQPGREAIAIGAGKMHARVEKDRGGFRVDTPLGVVEVLGTEFSTEIVRVGPQGGSRIAVRVTVDEGRVRCRFGPEDHVLRSGASHVFGGDERSGISEAVVVAAGERQLRLRVGDEETTVDVVGSESQVGARRIAIGAWPEAGDVVQISWSAGDQGFAVTDMRGRITGRVTVVDKKHIELVTPAGRRRTFLVGWVSPAGRPANGEEQIAASSAAVARQHVGGIVEVFWGMHEGLRVVDIEPRD